MNDPQPVEQAILTYTGAAIVTRWVVVAEAIEADGEPTLHTFTSPGLPLWMKYAMLRWEAEGLVPQPIWTLSDDDEDD